MKKKVQNFQLLITLKMLQNNLAPLFGTPITTKLPKMKKIDNLTFAFHLKRPNSNIHKLSRHLSEIVSFITRTHHRSCNLSF